MIKLDMLYSNRITEFILKIVLASIPNVPDKKRFCSDGIDGINTYLEVFHRELVKIKHGAVSKRASNPNVNCNTGDLTCWYTKEDADWARIWDGLFVYIRERIDWNGKQLFD